MSDRRRRHTKLHAREAGFSLVEMMVVIAFMATISAIAIPMISKALASMRLNGAIRGIANTAAGTKTKAGAQFTRARLYIDLAANSYHIETWVIGAPSQWVADTGPTLLPVNVTFGFGPVTAPPTNTQPAIAPAPPCLDSAVVPAPIANTACIVFNSRGIPIADNGAPSPLDAVYITDGTAVLGVTVSMTGLIGVWATPSQVAPSWTIS